VEFEDGVFKVFPDVLKLTLAILEL